MNVRFEDTSACIILCDARAQIFLHARNGAVQDVSSEPVFDGATRVLTIPGDEVRFPGIRFHAIATLPNPDTGAPERVRFPKRGSYRIKVIPEVRARFLMPDGTPASSATVFVAPGFGHGGVFSTQTDGEGRIDVSIPTDTRYMRNQRRTNGYTNVYFHLVSEWPKEGSTRVATEKEALIGDAATTVNLGNQNTVARPSIQDKTFKLRAEDYTFTPQSRQMACPQSQVCYYMEPPKYWATFVPAIYNGGGGVDMRSRYRYGSSDFTTTTWAVHASVGWVEMQNEVSATQRHEQLVGTSWVGPATTAHMKLDWDFVEERIQICFAGVCGDPRHTLRPYAWINGGHDVPHYPGYHDRARGFRASAPLDYDSCTVSFGGEYHTTVAAGAHHRFSVGVGASGNVVVPLSARTEYVTEAGTELYVQHDWARAGSTRRYHYLYVPGNGDGQLESRFGCLAVAPYNIWTHASNSQMLPIDPPARR